MVLPGVDSPQAQKKSNDIKVDPSCLVETYFFQHSTYSCLPLLLSKCIHKRPQIIQLYHHRFQKTVALLLCSMDEIGKSRMVLPGVGSPETHIKSNDIKVDPSFLVETQMCSSAAYSCLPVPFSRFNHQLLSRIQSDRMPETLSELMPQKECQSIFQIECQKQLHAKCQKNARQNSR